MMDNFDRYVAQAIQWARAHLGSEDYPARCLAFVEDAYERSNHIEMFGGSTAKESADAYDVYSHVEQPPPLGAFVFYDGTMHLTKHVAHRSAYCWNPLLVIRH